MREKGDTMSQFKNLLVVEQHKGRAEEIANDVIELFDYYFIATSASETEAFVREYDIDMILINPFFTDGSGRQFIEILRKNTHLHTTPILIMSRLPEDKVKLIFMPLVQTAIFNILTIKMNLSAKFNESFTVKLS